MRIVAGDLKGRSIEAPDGMGTRPTTDRVREALFSSLYSLLGEFDGLTVLDAFAGSGALGIEAISRGASRAVFYESDRKAASTLKRNVSACGLGSDKAQIVQRDIFKAPPASGPAGFDLVFLDPPYAYEPARVLELAAGIGGDTTVVYEHALDAKARVADAAEANDFDVLASKKYGKTGITVLRPKPQEGTL